MVDLQAKSHAPKRLLRPSINWLLVFIPVSVGLERLHVSPPLLFFSAALAIVPIALMFYLVPEASQLP
jgi:Ca2+/H+ antiporter